jgi:hypothetical protein
VISSHNNTAPRRSAAPSRRVGIFVCVLAAWCGLALAAQSPLPTDAVGNIEGDDLVVQSAPNEAMVVQQGVAPLDSGASITVRSGQALVQLGDGGEIGVCGPAHFSVLRSGGAITLALDYGRVHPKLPPVTSVVIYTPLIAATPIAIGQEQRDLTVGLASDGAMCVTSSEGAVRVSQQLSDESVIVPEGGAIALADGALAPAGESATCSCEVRLARNAPPPPPYEAPPADDASAANQPAQFNAPLRPVDSPPPAAPAPAASSDADQPIYQVFMPALTFNAEASQNQSTPQSASSPAPSPQMIVILRHARVQPGALFIGVVEAASLPAPKSPAPSAPAPRPQPSPAAAPAPTPAPVAAPPRPGMYQRVREYFRHWFGSSP